MFNVRESSEATWNLWVKPIKAKPLGETLLDGKFSEVVVRSPAISLSIFVEKPLTYAVGFVQRS